MSIKSSKKKTTINLEPRYIEMLEKIDREFGSTQNNVIRFGIIQAYRFYFPGEIKDK